MSRSVQNTKKKPRLHLVASRQLSERKTLMKMAKKLKKKGFLVLAEELGEITKEDAKVPTSMTQAPFKESGSFWKKLRVIPNPIQDQAAKKPACIVTPGGQMLFCTNQKTAQTIVKVLSKVPNARVLVTILVICTALYVSRGFILNPRLYKAIWAAIRRQKLDDGQQASVALKDMIKDLASKTWKGISEAPGKALERAKHLPSGIKERATGFGKKMMGPITQGPFGGQKPYSFLKAPMKTSSLKKLSAATRQLEKEMSSENDLWK